MARTRTKIFAVISLILLTFSISVALIYAKSSPSVIEKSITNRGTNDYLIYDSNLHTGLDDLRENTQKGSLNTDDKLVKVSSNNKYELYFNEKLCIFKVKNNETGYIYASAMDKIDDSASNNYYGGLLSSSFSIEYYNYNQKSEDYDINVLKAWVTKATKLSASEKNKIKEENPDITNFDFKIGIAPSTEYSYEYLENGVKVKIVFANATTLSTDKTYSLEIGFSAYVTLDDNGLHVEIPNDEIIENGDAKLSSIMVMPLMGGTYNNEVPGYMVIPDGSGALVRYGYNTNGNAKQLTLNYYGKNLASEIQGVSNDYLSSNKTLNLPIFGYVNGINQDGVYGIIESGSRQASLTISPSGSLNINYNFMIPTFTKRYRYLQYGVNGKLIDNLYDENIKVTYHFLENELANYVGIARDYQKYLLDNQELFKTSSDIYKTQIDFLMSETVAGALGNKTITMTSLASAKDMYEELKSLGLTDMIVVLKGWNKSGLTGSTPYDIKLNTKLGSKSKFKDFFEQLKNDGTNLYLYNDYVIGYSNGDVSKQKDVARSDLRLRMNFTDEYATLYKDYFYLYPLSTKTKLIKNIKKYEKLDVAGLAIDSIGDTLYSYYYQNKLYTRNDSYKIYSETLKEASDKFNIALYTPNEYMYKYLSDYLEMPMYTNNYVIYSDTVPLVPYVLKGYVDYYSEYANFNAIGMDQYLRMLDYGCFPSYILTNEISYNLKYTNSVGMYTTAYKDFKETIINHHNIFKDTYQKLLNSTVIERNVLKIGLVEVVYQNITTGVKNKVMINYNSKEEVVGNLKIDAKSFILVGDYNG